MAAEGYIKKHFPGSERLTSHLPGYSGKNNQFDQIWRTAEGKIMIVEAKGGRSPLGTRAYDRKQVQQGTPEYVESTIQAMEKWVDNNGRNVAVGDIENTIKAIRENSELLEYRVVRQSLLGTGKPSDVLMTNYKISK